MDPISPDKLTVNELRAVLSDLGLPTHGLKAELVSRVREHNGPPESDGNEDDDVDYTGDVPPGGDSFPLTHRFNKENLQYESFLQGITGYTWGMAPYGSRGYSTYDVMAGTSMDIDEFGNATIATGDYANRMRAPTGKLWTVDAANGGRVLPKEAADVYKTYTTLPPSEIVSLYDVRGFPAYSATPGIALGSTWDGGLATITHADGTISKIPVCGLKAITDHAQISMLFSSCPETLTPQRGTLNWMEHLGHAGAAATALNAGLPTTAEGNTAMFAPLPLTDALVLYTILFTSEARVANARDVYHLVIRRQAPIPHDCIKWLRHVKRVRPEHFRAYVSIASHGDTDFYNIVKDCENAPTEASGGNHEEGATKSLAAAAAAAVEALNAASGSKFDTAVYLAAAGEAPSTPAPQSAYQAMQAGSADAGSTFAVLGQLRNASTPNPAGVREALKVMATGMDTPMAVVAQAACERYNASFSSLAKAGHVTDREHESIIMQVQNDLLDVTLNSTTKAQKPPPSALKAAPAPSKAVAATAHRSHQGLKFVTQVDDHSSHSVGLSAGTPIEAFAKFKKETMTYTGGDEKGKTMDQLRNEVTGEFLTMARITEHMGESVLDGTDVNEVLAQVSPADPFEMQFGNTGEPANCPAMVILCTSRAAAKDLNDWNGGMQAQHNRPRTNGSNSNRSKSQNEKGKERKAEVGTQQLHVTRRLLLLFLGDNNKDGGWICRTRAALKQTMADAEEKGGQEDLVAAASEFRRSLKDSQDALSKYDDSHGGLRANRLVQAVLTHDASRRMEEAEAQAAGGSSPSKRQRQSSSGGGSSSGGLLSWDFR